MPDFPSELVEAAAKALLGSGPLPTTWDESWDELPKHQRKELRAAGAAVLTAVLPLIEQAERDRLAKQAGEPPFTYPHEDGDFLVIAPECFTDGEVVCWRGENYVRQELLHQTEDLLAVFYDGEAQDADYRAAGPVVILAKKRKGSGDA